MPLFWRIIGRTMALTGLIFNSSKYTNVQYPSSDGRTTLGGYLALPPGYSEETTYPTALVWHAWNGMSEEPVYFADLLAEQGYIVLAPDLFRGVSSRSWNIPWNIATVSRTPQSRINADMNAALEYLRENVAINESLLMSGPGFCFGGSQALEFSKRNGVAATISLYGSYIDGLQDATDDEAWGLLGMFSPILGIFGAEDDRPSPEQALGFANAMELRDIEHNVTIYDGVGHAFVNPEAHREGSRQAVAAWNQVVEFMNGVVATGGITRSHELEYKELELSVHAKEGHASRSFIWDHAMDPVLHKGHFSHF
jgi:carboxymethylenebutenolidase